MAEDSTRELILVKVVDLIKTIDDIKTVQRVHPTIQDLEMYASTQLPMAAVVGQLPVPEEKIKGRGPGATRDYFRTVLRVNVYVYFLDNVNPDTTLSCLLDDLWNLFYSNQQLDNLCHGLSLKPEMEVGIFPPYYAFLLSIDVTYFNTIEGI